MDHMPECLKRTIIYESEHVCLYTDQVRLPSGYIIEKYHQIHYPKEAVAIVIFNELNISLSESSRSAIQSTPSA